VKLPLWLVVLLFCAVIAGTLLAVYREQVFEAVVRWWLGPGFPF
jgi:hypothetical protein